jgi:hypothetical protein
VTSTDRLIRASAVLAVAAVAAVAGWISYTHAVAVVTAHGERGTVGHLYPVVIDGLIFVSSMVLLDSARRQVDAPPLARWMLAAGIAATLFANVSAGISYGVLGAAVAAWPAAALVGSYELLMLLVRGQARDGAAEAAQWQAQAPVPADGKLAELFGPELEAGTLPGIRKIKSRAHVGSPKAGEIRSHLQGVLAGSNGSGKVR